MPADPGLEFGRPYRDSGTRAMRDVTRNVMRAVMRAVMRNVMRAVPLSALVSGN